MKKLFLIFSAIAIQSGFAFAQTHGYSMTSLSDVSVEGIHANVEIVTEAQTSCVNPANNQQWMGAHMLPPVGDSCLGYADQNTMVYFCTDTSDQHNYRHIDLNTFTIYESGWFGSADSILVPVAAQHFYHQWVNTICGTDTVGWSAQYSFNIVEVNPPFLCPSALHMSHLIVVGNPISSSTTNMEYIFVSDNPFSNGSVTVTDLGGTILASTLISISSGINDNFLSISLTSGLYVLNVHGFGEDMQTELIVQ